MDETTISQDDIFTIENLVSELARGDIPEFVAISQAARLGWVLIPEYPTIAQHVSSRQCASCKSRAQSGGRPWNDIVAFHADVARVTF
jgi:hypothetical protein